MDKQFETLLASTKELGFVEKVGESTVEISGLPDAHLGEMVMFENGQIGQIMALRSDLVEVLLMTKEPVRSGMKATRTGQKTAVPVDEKVLGNTIDVLGRSVKTGRAVASGTLRVLDEAPAGIMRRRKIDRPMNTGVILVDSMVPLGLGQRELIIGDRKTGKSYFLLQTIMAAAKAGMICVYAAIGKKKTEVMEIEEYCAKQNILEKTVIVAASSQDSNGEIFTCPYTAMSIAEYFRDKGQDVLVVLDDMTTHAMFYRELALTAKRFPGRDSYPGDIFHIHSKLLERAGNFVVDDKNVSITCLPVSDTVQGDISGYIQTNLMSMTDGHIYFDGELFFKGRRPAVNPFISVTRVGRQTQTPLWRDAGRMLFELLNAYERTQSFLKFGAELGENSRQVLAMGERLFAFFDQPIGVVVQPSVQIVMLAALISGQWGGQNTVKVINRYDADLEFKKTLDGMVAGSENLTKLMEACRVQAGVLQEVWQ